MMEVWVLNPLLKDVNNVVESKLLYRLHRIASCNSGIIPDFPLSKALIRPHLAWYIGPAYC